MIVMPGAWRCERHRLWTNGDCPDCDLDADERAADEAREVEAIRRAAYLGDSTRNPERDVRFLLSLLGRDDD